MKNLFPLVAGIFAIAAGSSALTSCGKTDTVIVTPPANEKVVVVSANIKSNTTWTADKTYVLAGRIAVEAGAELTIEAGTVIKGQAGSGANATALIIARGAKINAVGTATKPIIFTSIADEIESGYTSLSSPNMDDNLNGLWGGLIILGSAPASLSGDVTELSIEGIPPTDVNGLYGGNNSADNSGVLKYISIRHGGANIGEGNEINGLTLGAVGSGTTIENIEVISNQDDGIEFFGGTVNAKNLVVWNSGDDGLDTDQSFGGSIDKFVVICGNNTDHALEIDGPEGSMKAGHKVSNGTCVGNDASELGDFRSNALGTFENIYFYNFPDPATDGRGDLSLSSGSDVTFAAGELVFKNIEVTMPSTVTDLTKILKNGVAANGKAVAAGANTVGASTAAFKGWTRCDAAGVLPN
ncbi:MAG: hypothetical protein ACO3GK_00100 [Bacteroidia bacterium]